MKNSYYYKELYRKFIISRTLNKKDIPYTERHHIKPRCLGGTNNTDNIIALTPREHYFAHLILSKAYPKNNKLKHALSAMAYGNKRNLTSNQYHLIKIAITKRLPEKIILEKMYFDKNMSFRKIATKFKVSDMTVCKWFKILNITPKNNIEYSFKRPSKETLVILLRSKGPKEISKIYKVSISLIYKWLKAYMITPERTIGIEKPIPSKKRLVDLYFRKNLSKLQVRRQLNNISSELLNKWFARYNLKFRNCGRRKKISRSNF